MMHKNYHNRKRVFLPVTVCIALLVSVVFSGCHREALTVSSESSPVSSEADISSQQQESSETSQMVSSAVSSAVSSEIPPVSAAVSEEPEQPVEFLALLDAAGYSVEDVAAFRQLVLVSSSGSYAEVYCYEKNDRGEWAAALATADGFVGVNGVGEAREGSLYTPYGLYSLDFAFGNAADPGTAMEYRTVTDSIYWVDDPDSRFYNQWVDAAVEVRDWDSAEHLSAVSVYDYAVVIGYNKDCIPGKGSAFFLHSSSGSPTAGCVSVPSSHMVDILRWLDPGCDPHIIMF